MKFFSGTRMLAFYSGIVTAALAAVMLTGSASKTKDFDEINVKRINVVEPDGTLRMVISDHARLPGIVVK